MIVGTAPFRVDADRLKSTGDIHPKTQLGRANREDGKRTGQNAGRTDRKCSTHGAARDEHKH